MGSNFQQSSYKKLKSLNLVPRVFSLAHDKDPGEIGENSQSSNWLVFELNWLFILQGSYKTFQTRMRDIIFFVSHD